MSGILKRYGELLPLTDSTPRLSLGEGNTPLLRLARMGDGLGIDLHVKVEGMNPTGSFKDRGMVLAVSKALEEGTRAVVCASTGNTSASAAAYAAAAGIPCFVLLPAGKVAMGKLAQATALGARVLAVRGNFDQALDLAVRASREMGLTLVNSLNPYRLWGQRTAAWEVTDELGKAPDWLAIPVGNAGNITAYWTGFVQYKNLGMSNSVPRMMGFQAEGSCPLVKGEVFDNPETVATAIRIGRPVSGKKAIAAARMTGGSFVSVTDAEILEAQHRLASSEGVFAEPASCAPLAGLFKLHREGSLPGGIRVVAVLTGNGLKDTETATKGLPKPIEIEGSWDSLREALS
ncbi:MAG: threonine synthase [Synergistales bacterium]